MERIIKKAFAEAYLELSKTKFLNSISVKDLADYCGLSRQTFYNYFTEKHDLLIWIYLSGFGDTLEEFRDYDIWSRRQCAMMAKNKHFFIQAYKTTDFLQWQENWIYKKMSDYIITIYGKDVFTDELNYTLKSYVFGAFSIFEKNLLSGKDVKLDENADIDLQNMPESLRKYFPKSK